MENFCDRWCQKCRGQFFHVLGWWSLWKRENLHRNNRWNVQFQTLCPSFDDMYTYMENFISILPRNSKTSIIFKLFQLPTSRINLSKKNPYRKFIYLNTAILNILLFIKNLSSNNRKFSLTENCFDENIFKICIKRFSKTI